MKTTTLLIAIILLTSNNLFSQKKNLPVFTAKIDGWHKADSINRHYSNDTPTYLHVRTFIKNNSADTLCYLDWSCSWMEFYIVDSKELYFPGWECTRNGLRIIKIPPYQTVERLLLLDRKPYMEVLSMKDNKNEEYQSIKYGIAQLHGKKLKIGFKLYTINITDFKNVSHPDPWKYKTSENEVILWSNELELP